MKKLSNWLSLYRIDIYYDWLHVLIKVRGKSGSAENLLFSPWNNETSSTNHAYQRSAILRLSLCANKTWINREIQHIFVVRWFSEKQCICKMYNCGIGQLKSWDFQCGLVKKQLFHRIKCDCVLLFVYSVQQINTIDSTEYFFSVSFLHFRNWFEQLADFLFEFIYSIWFQ